MNNVPGEQALVVGWECVLNPTGLEVLSRTDLIEAATRAYAAHAQALQLRSPTCIEGVEISEAAVYCCVSQHGAVLVYCTDPQAPPYASDIVAPHLLKHLDPSRIESLPAVPEGFWPQESPQPCRHTASVRSQTGYSRVHAPCLPMRFRGVRGVYVASEHHGLLRDAALAAFGPREAWPGEPAQLLGVRLVRADSAELLGAQVEGR